MHVFGNEQSALLTLIYMDSVPFDGKTNKKLRIKLQVRSFDLQLILVTENFVDKDDDVVLFCKGSAGEPGDDTVPGSSMNDFVTEYAKSNRSTCRGCDDKIDKVHR